MTTQEMRELDAWIAEHVMGGNIEPHWKCRDCGETVQNDRVTFGEYHDGCNGQCDFIESAHYTTDPAAALEVLQKCAEKLRDLEIAVEIYAPTRSEPSWFVLDSEGSISGIAPTLPLAICLFACEIFKEDGK